MIPPKTQALVLSHWGHFPFLEGPLALDVSEDLEGDLLPKRETQRVCLPSVLESPSRAAGPRGHFPAVHAPDLGGGEGERRLFPVCSDTARPASCGRGREARGLWAREGGAGRGGGGQGVGEGGRAWGRGRGGCRTARRLPRARSRKRPPLGTAPGRGGGRCRSVRGARAGSRTRQDPPEALPHPEHGAVRGPGGARRGGAGPGEAVLAEGGADRRGGDALLGDLHLHGLPEQVPAGQPLAAPGRAALRHLLPVPGHGPAVQGPQRAGRLPARSRGLPGRARRPQGLPQRAAAVGGLHRHDHLQQPLPQVRGRGLLPRGPLPHHRLQRAALLPAAQADHLPLGPALVRLHHRWFLAGRGPGGRRGHPVVGGHPVRGAGQPLRLAQCHLHQEGAAGGGRQHLAADLLQQRQRVRPLPPPAAAVWGAADRGRLRQAGQRPLLGHDDPGRALWLCHRLRDGPADQVHQSPDPQRVRHGQSLRSDGPGCPVLRGDQKLPLVDQQPDGAGRLLGLHLGEGAGDEEGPGGAGPQGGREGRDGRVSLPWAEGRKSPTRGWRAQDMVGGGA